MIFWYQKSDQIKITAPSFILMFHSEPHLNMAILYDNIDSLKNYLIVDLNFEYIMIPLFFILQLWKQGGVQCLKYFLKVLNTTQCAVFHFYSTRGKKETLPLWLSSWGQEFSNTKCHIYIMTRVSCPVIPGPHYSIGVIIRHFFFYS